MTDHEREAFGDKVRIARDELDMSQEKLAETTGVSRDTIRRLEKGEKTNFELGYILSVALQKAPDYFCETGYEEKIDDERLKLNFMFGQLDAKSRKIILGTMQMMLED